MSKTIMIAASDPNIIYLLQRYAEESGFCTLKASRDNEVPELAQQVQPALILLEVDPPGTNGHYLLQQLQVRTTTRDIPVVVYSNMDDDVDDEFIESFGDAAGCLHKSVMYEDFVAALQQAGVTP